MMHGLALLLKSILGHAEFKKYVTNLTQIITFMRASNKAYQAVVRAATKLNVKAKHFIQPGTTRITSVHMAIQSVRANEDALKRAVKDEEEAFTQTKSKGGLAVAAAVKTTVFWLRAEALDVLLDPITKVIMAVQSSATTIADVTR